MNAKPYHPPEAGGMVILCKKGFTASNLSNKKI